MNIYLALIAICILTRSGKFHRTLSFAEGLSSLRFMARMLVTWVAVVLAIYNAARAVRWALLAGQAGDLKSGIGGNPHLAIAYEGNMMFWFLAMLAGGMVAIALLPRIAVEQRFALAVTWTVPFGGAFWFALAALEACASGQ